MLVNSLDKMEQIVSKNSTLSWDGWNVVELIKSKTGMFNKNGVYVNGVWYIKKIFSVDRDGWRIPNKYVG
jgi:hypothetical protein